MNAADLNLPPPAESSKDVVARTLADLARASTVARIHIAEALSYRRIALPR